MVDGAALLSTMMWAMRSQGSWGDDRGANLLDGGAPFYDTYECADGRFVAVGPLEPQFYAVMLDGQGIAHPRRMGIAAHFGLCVDRPTLGCAKSVLVGTYEQPLPEPLAGEAHRA